MIRKLQFTFRKNSFLRCLIKQIFHIRERKRILEYMIINYLSMVDRHPELRTVPNDKGVSRPGRHGNLSFAFSEHAGILGFHETTCCGL